MVVSKEKGSQQEVKVLTSKIPWLAFKKLMVYIDATIYRNGMHLREGPTSMPRDQKSANTVLEAASVSSKRNQQKEKSLTARLASIVSCNGQNSDETWRFQKYNLGCCVISLVSRIYICHLVKLDPAEPVPVTKKVNL